MISLGSVIYTSTKYQQTEPGNKLETYKDLWKLDLEQYGHCRLEEDGHSIAMLGQLPSI